MVISVRDAADAVKLLGDVVKATREIVKAMNDGALYLKRTYPDASKQIEQLLEQMQVTVVGLAEVTKIGSSFRFVVSDLSAGTASAQSELARFNGYMIEQRLHVEKLKNNIRTLKGNCAKIRELRDKLDARARQLNLDTLFALLGMTSHSQASKLHAYIGEFYASDERMIQQIVDTLAFVHDALNDVDSSLGPPGIASPYAVPHAAALLGTYAALLKQSEVTLGTLVDELDDTRRLLKS